MPKATADYAEYRLVDPALLDRGVDGAVVMTVGVLLSRPYTDLWEETNPPRLARQVNSAISGIETTIAGRKKLSQGIEGTWIFYHCAGCGYDFTSVSCRSRRHQVTIPRNEWLIAKRSFMPRKVVKFAESKGHRFLFAPPRP